MQNAQPNPKLPDLEDKKSLKRHLARQLIQHIMSLFYSLLSQKIQHGVGMLWQQYFSQELYNIAKKRVQTDHISSVEELNTWFQKLSINIREKINQLSGGLVSHFDTILEEESKCYNQQISGRIQLTKDETLAQKQLQRISEVQHQKNRQQSVPHLQGVCINKERSSIYEKQCPWCNNAIAIRANLIEGVLIVSIDGQMKENFNNLELIQNDEMVKGEVQSRSTTSTFVQKTTGGDFLIPEYDCDKKQSREKMEEDKLAIWDRRLEDNQTTHKTHFSKENQHRISTTADLEEDQMQGGFYGIFLGLLDIFQM